MQKCSLPWHAANFCCQCVCTFTSYYGISQTCGIVKLASSHRRVNDSFMDYFMAPTEDEGEGSSSASGGEGGRGTTTSATSDGATTGSTTDGATTGSTTDGADDDPPEELVVSSNN